MRVSVHEDDPGYQTWVGLVDHNVVDVFLDGIQMQYVETADEEDGSVVHCVLDAEGGPQIDPNHSDRVWTIKSYGKVEVKLRPKSAEVVK